MKNEYYDSSLVILEQPSLPSYSDVPCLCNDKKMESFQNSMDYGDIEIEIATVDCSSENSMKGGYGIVIKVLILVPCIFMTVLNAFHRWQS